MEIIFEVIAELLFEVVFALVGELFVDIAMHVLGSPVAPNRKPAVVRMVGYGLLGALLGGLSLLIAPYAQFESPTIRLVYLFVTPLLGGAMMAALGWLRRSGGRPTVPLESFAYGLWLVLPITLLRYFFAQ